MKAASTRYARLMVFATVMALISVVASTAFAATPPDAAAPAIFLALLWPQLARNRGLTVALGAVIVTLSLVTVVPAGIPILAAAAVAILAGLLPDRRRRKTGVR